MGHLAKLNDRINKHLWTQWQAHAVVAHPASVDTMHWTYDRREQAEVCGLCAATEYHGSLLLPMDNGQHQFIDVVSGDSVPLLRDREMLLL